MASKNLEKTIEYLLSVSDSGIKPEKFLLFSELPSYVVEANVGKYYIVDVNNVDNLYYITKRNNDGLIAENLGVWPKVGPTGIQGEKGDSPVITISNNSTWVIDGVDTGKPTKEKGDTGNQGIRGPAGLGIDTLTNVETYFSGDVTYSDNVATFEGFDTLTYNGTTHHTATKEVHVPVKGNNGVSVDVDSDSALVVGLDMTGASDGKVLTCNSSNQPEWKDAGGGGGGTQLYLHTITGNSYSPGTYYIVSKTATAYSSMYALKDDVKANNVISGRYIGKPDPDFTSNVYCNFTMAVMYDMFLRLTMFNLGETSTTNTYYINWTSFASDTVTTF